MAFSTAEFLVHDSFEITHRQFGHVAVSSRIRASARMCVKQPAHIKCPLVHCYHKKNKKLIYSQNVKIAKRVCLPEKLRITANRGRLCSKVYRVDASRDDHSCSPSSPQTTLKQMFWHV